MAYGSSYQKTMIVHDLHAVKTLVPRGVKLYEGKDILELDARGLLLDARCSELDACRLLLESLGA
jgi:hypothetical protein